MRTVNTREANQTFGIESTSPAIAKEISTLGVRKSRITCMDTIYTPTLASLTQNCAFFHEACSNRYFGLVMFHAVIQRV